jgi:GT2 family glycosyltransferase
MQITRALADSSAERIWTVIVNWRQTETTLACLASLEQGGAERARVVVVDNESNGDLERRVRAASLDVVVLAQSENLGFAQAVNLGARYALARGATGVLLLNNDAVLLPGAMQHLTEKLADDRELGVITAKVFLTEAPDRLWAVGGVFTGRRVVEMGAGERDVGAYDDARLDFVYGCAMLMRADMFRELGGFDERFFLYYEDIDLCLRARAAGWRVGMAPNAHVLHEGSKSTRGEPTIKIYHHARSRLLFFSRHLREAKGLFAASEVAFIARRVAMHLVAGESGNAVAYIRGTIDGMRSRAVGHTPGGTAVAASGHGG